MPTAEEIQKAKAFLSRLAVPDSLKGIISMKTNEDGSVTVTNLRTQTTNTITKEQAIEALARS